MNVAERMHEKLNVAFAPSALRVQDDSAKHAGHAGARPGGETHFSVRIVSGAFEGLSRVDRQRMVYFALADELREQVHALSVTALTDAEAARG
jgi:BolA family transcriptional regulator, general stress-responsive regulator